MNVLLAVVKQRSLAVLNKAGLQWLNNGVEMNKALSD